MKKNREMGVDCLRILSMLMIVVLHILGKGGILESSEVLSVKYKTAWFLEILCYCAVNCFAMISGYIMIFTKIKYKNLLSLWFQVFFYSLGITILLDVLNGEWVSIGLYFRAVTPVLAQQYWYFTAYFGMFLILPFINKFILCLNKKQNQWFLGISLFMISVVTIIYRLDSFYILDGYSLVWLILMYWLGSYIRQYVDMDKIKSKKMFLLYLICVFGIWLNKILIENLTSRIFGEPAYGRIFIKYVSFPMVAAALFLFLGCIKLKFKNKGVIRIIKILSPMTFGVYLIHTHPLIFEFIWNNAFKYLLDCSPVLMTFKIVIWACILYLGCSFIDYLRIYLFKLINMDRICENIVESIHKICGKIMVRFGGD